jgi:NAD(P)-dependent dehydrogenase (short-subunit alcohol dehydrogenase family)
MQGKTVLITGASGGIGLEAARALAGMGADIVMVARDRARGEAAASTVRERATGSVELLLADLASLDEIRTLAKEFKASHTRLDVLLNNAGAHNATRHLSKDGYELTFAVNHLAYFLLTELLLDVLKASAPSRIVNVSSGAHHRGRIDFDDVMGERSYGGFRAYGQSKLANVLHAYELARRLEGTGVTANALHPGVVATGFGKNNAGALGTLFGIAQVIGRPFYISPERGAATSVYLASSPAVDGVSGRYFSDCRAAPSSSRSHDEDAAKRLWALSERLTGITQPAESAAGQPAQPS